MSPIEDMNTSILIKKGSIYAMTALVVTAIGASWSFTWNAAADRTTFVKTLETHATNKYIHNMDDKLVTEKDLQLYFKAMNVRFDNIELRLKELKEDK